MKAKKDQFQRFLKAAREHGVDDTGAELERAFAKIVPPKRKPVTNPSASKTKRRRIP
jgi:hypothetical protein